MSKNNYIFGNNQVGSSPREQYQNLMDMVLETSYDALLNSPNEYKEAVCLSGGKFGAHVVYGEDAKKIATDGGDFWDIKIHRESVEAKFGLKNPYGKNTMTNDSERSNYIKMHPYARSENSLTKAPEWGDIVLVKEQNNGMLLFKTTKRKATVTVANAFKEDVKDKKFDKKIGDHKCAQEQAEAAHYEAISLCGEYEFKSYARSKPPDAIVIHYTVDDGHPATSKYMSKTVLAYHFVINHDGSVYMMVSPDKKTNHVKFSKLTDTSFQNTRSIGISFANWGHGVRSSKRYNALKAAGMIYKSSDGREWEKYTNEQITAVIGLVNKLKSKYNISSNRIKGHSEIQSNKPDPGPAFDMGHLGGGAYATSDAYSADESFSAPESNADPYATSEQE